MTRVTDPSCIPPAQTERRACALSRIAACLATLATVPSWGADLPADYVLPPAPGPFVSGAEHDLCFSSGQPIIATSYFYWYDADTKEHTVNHDGSDALTDHPTAMAGMSYRNPDWHAAQLSDMIEAGIDIAMPVYWGTPGAPRSWSDVGLPPLVEARARLIREGKRPPRIGMFYDTSTLRHNPRRYHVDLRTEQGRKWFYGTIRNFFSYIPPQHRACVDGCPVVFLYSPAFANGVDEKLFPSVRRMFREDFGTDLFLVKMEGWPGKADSTYNWGGAIRPRYLQVAGIGPGYDHSAVPGRAPLVRDREAGKFYARAWERLLVEPTAGRPWLVHVETWNEFHEGTEICETKEYGRKYIELTRHYADALHARKQVASKHLEPAPEIVSGTPGKADGIRIVARPESDGPLEEKTVSGKAAWCTKLNKHSPHNRYLYFQVDDRFLGLGDKTVEVTICYFDEGPNQFLFEYDSADPAVSGIAQRFRLGHRQPIGGTKEWKKVSFVIPHAQFSGRANGGDFRLVCKDGELAIHVIAMRRQDP